MTIAADCQIENHVGAVVPCEVLRRRTDREIVEAATAGEAASFEELYRRYHKLVRFIVGPILGNPEDVENCVQDIFLIVYRRLESFDVTHRFSGWISTIARREAWRAANKARPSESLEEHETRGHSFVSSEPSPHRVVESRERLDEVRQRVSRMPQEYQILFTLAFDEDLSTAEIAERTSQPRRRVQVRLNQLRTAIRLGRSIEMRQNEARRHGALEREPVGEETCLPVWRHRRAERRPVDEEIGDRIRSARASQSLTQGGLAAMIGYSQSQVSNYEMGECSVRASVLAAVSRHLQQPIGYFFYDDTGELNPRELQLIAAWRAKDRRLLLSLIDEHIQMDETATGEVGSTRAHAPTTLQ